MYYKLYMLYMHSIHARFANNNFGLDLKGTPEVLACLRFLFFFTCHQPHWMNLRVIGASVTQGGIDSVGPWWFFYMK